MTKGSKVAGLSNIERIRKRIASVEKSPAPAIAKPVKSAPAAEGAVKGSSDRPLKLSNYERILNGLEESLLLQIRGCMEVASTQLAKSKRHLEHVRMEHEAAETRSERSFRTASLHGQLKAQEGMIESLERLAEEAEIAHDKSKKLIAKAFKRIRDNMAKPLG